MGLWIEPRKGLGWRLRFSRPAAVRYFQKRPTNVFAFRYENADGVHRTITCPVGWGRFNRGTEDAAYELAERRLNEQFGDECLAKEERMAAAPGSAVVTIGGGAELLRARPELHQDNYELVKVTRL